MAVKKTYLYKTWYAGFLRTVEFEFDIKIGTFDNGVYVGFNQISYEQTHFFVYKVVIN